MYVDLIINEEDDKANALIAKIMSEETKKAYRDMLIEDGDLEVEAPESDEVIDTPVEPAEVDVTSDDSSSDDSSSCDDVSAANSQFVDLHKDIERLKKLFNKLQDGDEIDDTTVAVEEDGAVPADGEASPLTFANESEEENIFNESLELSTVKTDGTSEKEVGNGGKVSIDKTSTINSDKARDKKGSPINIKSTGDAAPNGGLQKAPEVKPSTIKSTNVMDLEKVPADGDASAELNSKAGFGSDDSDSPLTDIKIN